MVGVSYPASWQLVAVSCSSAPIVFPAHACMRTALQRCLDQRDQCWFLCVPAGSPHPRGGDL